MTNLNGKVVLGFGGGNGSLNLDIGEFLEAPGLPLVCGTVAAAFPMTGVTIISIKADISIVYLCYRSSVSTEFLAYRWYGSNHGPGCLPSK